MGNPDLGATGTNFMVILQSIDYSKFERFSNVAEEISFKFLSKFLSNFLEYEVLVVDIDRYVFQFSIKVAERKRRTEDSTHIQEIEIINNRNVQSHFKVTLVIRTIKPTW